MFIEPVDSDQVSSTNILIASSTSKMAASIATYPHEVCRKARGSQKSLKGKCPGRHELSNKWTLLFVKDEMRLSWSFFISLSSTLCIHRLSGLDFRTNRRTHPSTTASFTHAKWFTRRKASEHFTRACRPICWGLFPPVHSPSWHMSCLWDDSTRLQSQHHHRHLYFFFLYSFVHLLFFSWSIYPSTFAIKSQTRPPLS